MKGSLYAWNRGGTGGGTDLDDGGSGELGGDVGYYPDWSTRTHAYWAPNSAGAAATHTETNVIMWPGVGRLPSRTQETKLSTYLTR